MAKVREQSDGLGGNQANRKGDGLTGTNRKTDESASLPASGGWRTRIGSFFAPPPRTTGNMAQQDSKAARPQSSWGRLLFGFMVYLLGSFILQPLILLIFGWLHINPAARQPFFPANTWVIGTANVYTLVYFVFLALFIWALFRFNIIPRDPFGARAAAERRAGGASATGGTNGSSKSTTTPPPASSALRHAGRRRLPTTDGTSNPRPVRSFRSFLPSLPSLRPRNAAASTPATTTKTVSKTTAKPAVNAASVKATSVSTAKPAVKATAKPAANGHAAASNHDSHYDRVKAQQRSRRRKR